MNPNRIAGEWIPLRVLPNGALFVTRKGVLAIKINSQMAATVPGVASVEYGADQWEEVKQVAIVDLLAYTMELEEMVDDFSAQPIRRYQSPASQGLGERDECEEKLNDGR